MINNAIQSEKQQKDNQKANLIDKKKQEKAVLDKNN